MPEENLEELRKQLKQEKEKNSILDKQKNSYEENGPAKLYYALNRKAWEMAELLNSVNLKDIAIEDPKDKSFERLRYIINDASGIAAAVTNLGISVGVTGDEEKDVRGRKRITPESMSNVLPD